MVVVRTPLLLYFIKYTIVCITVSLAVWAKEDSTREKFRTSNKSRHAAACGVVLSVIGFPFDLTALSDALPVLSFKHIKQIGRCGAASEKKKNNSVGSIVFSHCLSRERREKRSEIERRRNDNVGV